MKLDRVIAVRNNKTVYRDGDTCVKVFRDGFSSGDIFHEAMNQSRLTELCGSAFRVPEVLEVTKIDGRWAIVSEYVKGRDLAQLAKEKPDKGESYCRLFVELQREMHRLTCPLFSRLNDKLDYKISLSPLEATHRFSLHGRLTDLPRNSIGDTLSVCHGDFVPSNVILTAEGVPYVIDWSHATQGNAAADCARTYIALLLRDTPEDAKRYLDTYCQIAALTPDVILSWVPMVAASLMVRCTAWDREKLTELARL